MHLRHSAYDSTRALPPLNTYMKPKSKKKKIKPKKYPLDEYIEQIWYDDWLKKQEAKGVVIDGKHYKIGGTD